MEGRVNVPNSARSERGKHTRSNPDSVNSTCKSAKENSTNETCDLGSNLPSKLRPFGHKANGVRIHSYTTPCTSNAIRQPATDWICSCAIYKQHACLYNFPGYFPCRLWSKPCEHSKPLSAVPPLSMTTLQKHAAHLLTAMGTIPCLRACHTTESCGAP